MKLKQLFETSIDEFTKEMLIKQIMQFQELGFFGRWTLRQDGSVDIDSDVDLHGGLKRFYGQELPFKFGKVSGNFYAHSNHELRSLKNFPDEVGKHFSISQCKMLTSLKGCPKKVGGGFIASYIPGLIEIEEFPDEVGDVVTFAGCSLKSLDGLPRFLPADLDVSFNDLTSFKGAPREIGGSLYAHRNRIETLEGSPREIGNHFYLQQNRLTNFKGAPRYVGGNFVATDNPIKDVNITTNVIGELFHDYN